VSLRCPKDFTCSIYVFHFPQVNYSHPAHFFFRHAHDEDTGSDPDDKDPVRCRPSLASRRGSVPDSSCEEFEFSPEKSQSTIGEDDR
jgi:hypothetical protein